MKTDGIGTIVLILAALKFGPSIVAEIAGEIAYRSRCRTERQIERYKKILAS